MRINEHQRAWRFRLISNADSHEVMSEAQQQAGFATARLSNCEMVAPQQAVCEVHGHGVTLMPRRANHACGVSGAGDRRW